MREGQCSGKPTLKVTDDNVLSCPQGRACSETGLPQGAAQSPREGAEGAVWFERSWGLSVDSEFMKQARLPGTSPGLGSGYGVGGAGGYGDTGASPPCIMLSTSVHSQSLGKESVPAVIGM